MTPLRLILTVCAREVSHRRVRGRYKNRKKGNFIYRRDCVRHQSFPSRRAVRIQLDRLTTETCFVFCSFSLSGRVIEE